MCGITGIYCFNNKDASEYKNNLLSALVALHKRGPDARGSYVNKSVGLGHTRLSIMDVSSGANQPFLDQSGRYVLIFNGEIFNFHSLKDELISKGEVFLTSSDTEVLFKLLIIKGHEVLNSLNGFFSFAFYDLELNTLLLARDRFGVKPLVFYKDKDKIVFASELKSLMEYGIPRELDFVSLYQYLQLNYVPGNVCMLKDVQKLAPGTFAMLRPNGVEIQQYYSIPMGTDDLITYSDAKSKLVEILEKAVSDRLEADVPLGLFLSGGIDSSVVTALASKHTENLKTFSIGYQDNPFFDETNYAKLVADKFKTDHTVFSLSSSDLLSDLGDMLDYIDEPFADSSALAVFILSRRTRKHVKVALSGDGADEIFSGYNKHMAEWNVLNNKAMNFASSLAHPFTSILPKSRNGAFQNFIRKIERYNIGKKLKADERYWRWCSITDESLAERRLVTPINREIFNQRKNQLLSNFKEYEGFKAVLKSDVDMVLANDMLVKVDMMSMANGLEVRNPFLDYRVLEFGFSLPDDFKIDGKLKKKVLQDAFRSILPSELYNRPKHGFEVPLLDWIRNELKPEIDYLLGEEFIRQQRIFSIEEIRNLKSRLYLSNPGDSPSQIWGIFVFQKWWVKYLSNFV